MFIGSIDYALDFVVDFIVDLFNAGDAVETINTIETLQTLHISDAEINSMIVKDIIETNPKIDKQTAILWTKKIIEQSIKYKINPFLIASQAKQESTWNPNALGQANDRGLLQVVDSTALEIANKLGYKNFNPEMLKDPLLNIEFSAYYLHHCYERTAKYIGNDIVNRDWLALASYNMGVIPAVKNYISGKLDKSHYVAFVKRYFFESYNGINVEF